MYRVHSFAALPLGSLLGAWLALAPGVTKASAVHPSAPPPQPRLIGLAKAAGQSCVEYSTQVVYKNYGYDHWVALRSACKRPVRCHLASDSNPGGVDRSLDPGASTSVLLFRGSPASEFTARVSCQEQ